MKTKNLVIIFILFLLITLGSGLVVFLTGEKNQPALNEVGGTINFSGQPPPAEEKQTGANGNEPISETATKTKPIVQADKTVLPEAGDDQAEQIQAAMLINGVKYETKVAAGSSVYDLMNVLKSENKIDFKGENYAGLGFFVEEINGVENNPAGENWLYYINGQPAQVGTSYYLIKTDDVIEWKYEKKSF